jgi:hypothetical protein
LIGPERAALLRLPFWAWPEFLNFALEVYQRVNGRSDHELEGWVKAGVTKKEWRLPRLPAEAGSEPGWFPVEQFLALPEAQRQALAGQIETRLVKLSPAEVFQRGQKQLQPVPLCLLPKLAGPAVGVVSTIRDGYVTVTDSEIDPDPMKFPAWNDGRKAGTPFEGRNGDEYLVYLNPFDPSRIILAHPKDNAFVAELPRQFAASWADVKAVEKQIGGATREMNERLRDLGIRNIPRARKRAEDTAHNAAVLESAAALTSAERRRESKSDEDALLDAASECALNNHTPDLPSQEPEL